MIAIAPCRPVDDTKLIWMPPWLKSFPPPQADATMMACTDCDIEVWVGPLNKAKVDAGAAKQLCYTCCQPYMAADVLEFRIPRGLPDQPRR
jgi:hypothetical protein